MIQALNNCQRSADTSYYSFRDACSGSLLHSTGFGIPGKGRAFVGDLVTPLGSEQVSGQRIGIVAGQYAVIARREVSPMDFLLARLGELEKLSADWNGHDSDPPTKVATTLARNVLDRFTQNHLWPERLSASAEGGVGMSFRKERLFASVECTNAGEIVALVSDGKGNPHAWEVATDRTALESAAKTIREFIGR